MKPIPASAPVPVLSNRLADLAERAGEAAKAYRRGSIESIRAYLTAGELLAEARGECRRGEWGAVLDRAGIEPRTARRMMQASRIVGDAGASAEDVHEAGGVQAFVAAAGEASEGEGEAAAGAREPGNGDGEKTVFKSAFSGLPAGDVGADMPVGGAEGVSDGDPGREPVAVPPRGGYGALGGAERLPGGEGAGVPAFVAVDDAGAPVGRGGARAVRLAAGLCACGAMPTPGYRTCEPCRTRDRARTRGRLAVWPTLRAAAKAGRGLSAGDVAKLVGGAGRKQ